MAVRQKSVVIRQFIIEHLESHPVDIVPFTADHWRITREAVRQHVKALEKLGVISSTGRTSAKRHSLNILARELLTMSTKGLQEDAVWSQHIKPLLTGVPANVLNICAITSSEMINNVIDHSESDEVAVGVTYTAASVDITIRDRGVGIFRKIKQACNLSEEREAILELSKGKLTTAPIGHSGYGVFFSCRMVDLFEIRSGRLVFTHSEPDDDWLFEDDNNDVDGTFIKMTIATTTKRTSTEVYNRFCGSPDDEIDLGFTRTHVPIRLAQYANDPLVSRSQAKRVLTRFEKFSEVILDFQGIELVGQAFADEIFRVFRNEHPEVQLKYINAAPPVKQMIRLAESASQ